MDIQAIKDKLPSPMENYKTIAEAVTKERSKELKWRSVMIFFGGNEKVVSEETANSIISNALEIIETNANDSLQLAKKFRDEVPA